jgi:uncharacterized RDD family membrane protein YckC
MTGLMNTASDGDFAPAPQLCDSGATVEAEVNSAPSLELEPWRHEVAARLARYRARRKPRAPRYPSLLLPFDSSDTWPRTAPSGAPSLGGPISSDDDFAFHESAGPAETLAVVSYAAEVSEQSGPFARTESAGPRPSSAVAAKIQTEANVIEFPRSAAIPVFQSSMLADPIFDRPRIVEASEIVPLPPALGGILIGPAPQPAETRAAGETRLPTPSIARRLLATGVDGLILAAALSGFAGIFLRLNPLRLSPLRGPLPLLAAAGGGVAISLWFVYQFLFFVYTGSTPGLHATRLKLTKFDGSPVHRSLRRWRVLASFLSGFSAGFGYLWCFLDADSLCWHDRITRTHLRSTR